MIRSQVSSLFDLWPAAAEWFLVGGTAGDLEAQAVKEAYPSVQCAGFEPNPEFREQQQVLGFPGTVHPVALWHNETDRLVLSYPAGRAVVGSVCRPYPSPDLERIRSDRHVPATPRTLDSLSAEFGPWNNVVLWLDIEWAEVQALEGAKELLRRTLLANVETFHHRNLPAVCRLMYAAGLELVRVWNVGESATKDAQDYVFVRR